MSWYWSALLIGVFVVPWIMDSSGIRISFEENGLQGGLGYWLSKSVIFGPLMVLIVWMFNIIL